MSANGLSEEEIASGKYAGYIEWDESFIEKNPPIEGTMQKQTLYADDVRSVLEMTGWKKP